MRPERLPFLGGGAAVGESVLIRIIGGTAMLKPLLAPPERSRSMVASSSMTARALAGRWPGSLASSRQIKLHSASALAD